MNFKDTMLGKRSQGQKECLYEVQRQVRLIGGDESKKRKKKKLLLVPGWGPGGIIWKSLNETCYAGNFLYFDMDGAAGVPV